MIDLIKKELQLELRRKSVLAGIGLYLFSLVFICYLTFAIKLSGVSEMLWSALFWLTILFSVITTVSKSFIGERKQTTLYYYTIASAKQIIVSKIIYNSILTFVVSTLGYILFYFFIGNPVDDHLTFYTILILSSIGFSASLSLISAIASKSNNSNVLMAVLSFPVIIGILLMAIRATKNALDGIDPSASYDELLNLLAINCILGGLAYMLFPYIWRS